jgi:hypothetical protein
MRNLKSNVIVASLSFKILFLQFVSGRGKQLMWGKEAMVPMMVSQQESSSRFHNTFTGACLAPTTAFTETHIASNELQ